MNSIRTSGRLFVATSFVAVLAPAGARAAPDAGTKTLIDYFLPTPIEAPLQSNVWGAAAVGPRDIDNGLEDPTIKQWCYWDGKIIKGPDGKYHMFASRWDQSKGHVGWGGSVAVHAVSDNPIGPYVDKGLLWPDNEGGKGHNVTALELPDGTYAVLVSTTRPGDIFTSPSLDGPWTYKGSVQMDGNGYDVPKAQNLSFIVRPDGSYLMVSTHGVIMLSTTGIMGPYKVQGPGVYPSAPGFTGTSEDPVIWYSGGQYHIVADWYMVRKAMHMVSPDGIHNWTGAGLAYDPTADFVRYTDGTVNHWYKMERPGVLIEDGHVTHFTLAVIDVEKNLELGNDQHGSKVIVVPFDGVSFDGGSADGGAGGTGGASGSGGATGSGGRTGSGGATAGGGAPGTGGAIGTGGRNGTGGTPTSGGTPDAGGTMGSGGSTESSGVGGVVSTGGTIRTGGGAVTGGTVAAGGASATGGIVGTGRAFDTGTVGAGGNPGTGGTSGTAVAGGASATAGATQADSGCSCRIADGQTAGYPGFALFALLMVAFRRRRRPRAPVRAVPRAIAGTSQSPHEGIASREP